MALTPKKTPGLDGLDIPGALNDVKKNIEGARDNLKKANVRGALNKIATQTTERVKKAFDFFKKLPSKEKTTLFGGVVALLTVLSLKGESVDDEQGNKKEEDGQDETVRSDTDRKPTRLKRKKKSIRRSSKISRRTKASSKKEDADQAKRALSPEEKKLYDHAENKSGGIEHSKTGSPVCSKTAADNFAKFGYKAPRGDAINIGLQYLKKGKGIIKGDDKKILKNLYLSDNYLTELFVRGKTQYDHRAMAFRSSADNQWYILDPYRKMKDPKTGKLRNTQDPIPFESYIAAGNKIDFAVKVV